MSDNQCCRGPRCDNCPDAGAGVGAAAVPSMSEVIAAALDALEDNDNHAATVILKTAQRNAGVTMCAACRWPLSPCKCPAAGVPVLDRHPLAPSVPSVLPPMSEE